jgi:TonB-linked SusC/RagA family outer membrane protein
MKKFLLFCMAFLLYWYSGAQDRTVMGRVTSTEDGAAIPGVNVLIKGTTNGTVTDSDGRYSISAGSANDALVFSFVGLRTQEVAIAGRATVDVSLGLDVTQLNEVVVTSLGIERSPQSLGYTVGKVKSDELNLGRAVNVGSALSGKVSGLQINTVNNGVNPTTRIVLRGNRSLTGNNQALIVIDGVQVPQEAINYLNPNDIDNVSILKGANAAALYGSEGSNGALIITTKKGTKEKTEITFSNTTNWEQINFMPKFQTKFGGGTEGYSRVFIPFENQSYGPRFDGKPVAMGRPLEDGTQEILPYKAAKDAKRKAFDVGITSQNDLSVAGGDNSGSYFLSVQNVKTKGIVPGDENQRTTLRINVDRKFNEKFRSGFNLSYSVKKTNSTTSNFYNNILNTPANIPLTRYRNWRNLTNSDGSMNYASPNNYFNDYFYNPYMQKDMNRSDARTNYLIGSMELGYKVTDFLEAIYRVGITNEQYDNQTWTEKFAYTAFAKASGKTIAASNVLGASNASNGYVNRFNQDFILSANKKFGDVSTGLILGTNVKETRRSFTGAGASSLVIPDLYNISNRVGEVQGVQFEDLSRTISYYGQVSVGYRDFVTLELTGRNDAVSVLSPANRSFFYPGASLSFVPTEAIAALKDKSLLSYAKLYISASKTGNVNVAPYSLQTVYGVGNGFPYGSAAGYTAGDTYADPNLKPEFTRAFEIGGEFTFVNDRVSLVAAYYKTETTNQTVSVDLATSTGYARARVNAGTVENNVREFSLKTTPIVTAGGFKAMVNINYTNIDNMVTDLYGDSKAINLSNLYGLTGDASLGQIYAEVGSQYPIVKAVAYKRDDQGRIIVDAVTGYPVKSSGLKTFGQANPKHTFSIQGILKYKGFSLSSLAEYRGGNVVYHGLAATMWFTGVAEATAAYNRERFVMPNSSIETEPGSGVYEENASVAVKDGGIGAWDSNLRNFGENFVTSGAFWKLREANLTYQFPASLLSKTKVIKKASISFVGRNLFTWVPKENKYTDPEFSLDNSNAVGLNNTLQTPPTRTLGFNLSVTF